MGSSSLQKAKSPQFDTHYELETFRTINDAPTLIYFSRSTSPEASPSKPLVVFIPGAFHLARIAYGGHEGSRAPDFLSYWFQKHGFPFLALSYPLECTPSVMPATRPDFTPKEWGAQAAESTRRTIEEQDLPNKDVILLFWSMGGKILQSYSEQAKKRKLNVKLAVSLAATPAIRGLREQMAEVTASPNGYWFAFTDKVKAYFLAQLHEQSTILGTSAEIIPDAIYIREYLGNTPVTMGAFGFRYSKEDAAIVPDRNAGYDDGGSLNMSDLPFLGSLVGNSPLDYRHTVADKATWGFIMAYQLMGVVNRMLFLHLFSQQALTTVPAPNDLLASGQLDAAAQVWIWLAKNPEKSKRIMQLIQDMTDKMTAVVPGNHHLFVGESGARQSVELIMAMEQNVEEFKANVLNAL